MMKSALNTRLAQTITMMVCAAVISTLGASVASAATPALIASGATQQAPEAAASGNQALVSARTPSRWTRLWSRFSADPAPRVGFRGNRVVGVVVTTATPAYTLTTDWSRDRRAATLTATVTPLSLCGQMAAQVLTHHYAFFAVPREIKKVDLALVEAPRTPCP